MKTQTQTINGIQRINIPGKLFRLLSTVNAVDVSLFRSGAAISAAQQVEAGFWVKEDAGFDAIEITTGASEAVKFLIAEGGDAGLDRTVGSVSVSNLSAQQGAMTQATATVTNASGQLLAANAARRYLLIQNNDASGNIFVRLDGAAATTANGVKIAAGGSYEAQGYVPTGAITAIGSIASNANVIVVEG